MEMAENLTESIPVDAADTDFDTDSAGNTAKTVNTDTDRGTEGVVADTGYTGVLDTDYCPSNFRCFEEVVDEKVLHLMILILEDSAVLLGLLGLLLLVVDVDTTDC